MILYRMYCNPGNGTVLGCEDEGQKLNRPQVAPRRVFKSEVDPADQNRSNGDDKLTVVQWAPFTPISGLTEGHVNEDLWLHFGYEPVGSLVAGQRTDPKHHLRCLSEVVNLARAKELYLFATLPENQPSLTALHGLLHSKGGLLATLPDLGPLLATANASRSKYDFWEAT